jgi:energy-coupling factor transporter ATP-binding protein EcfA2
MLTRAKIERFKCLHDVDVTLGPFNVLIGPNDSGKSSFLQALGEPQRSVLGGDLRMPQMRAAQPSVGVWSETSDVSLALENQGFMFSVAGQRGPLSTMHGSGAHRSVTDQAFMRISEPLMLEPMAVAAPSPKGSGVLTELIKTRGRGAAAHLARSALGDRKNYDVIQKGMHDITSGRIREVVVGEHTDVGYPLSFRLYNDTVIPASELSQGLLVFFAYLCIVHRDDAPAVLLIEEPENGVHPLRLHEIVALLRTLTERGVQILLTTHSPDLLNACKPEEVLVFRRPTPESGTEIRRLPADFERRAMRSTMGEIWASTGEEGLLDILPEVNPRIQAEAG